MSEIDALPVRFSASLMLIGKVFTPGVVAADTVARNENILSFGVASPLEPSSKKVLQYYLTTSRFEDESI